MGTRTWLSTDSTTTLQKYFIMPSAKAEAKKKAAAKTAKPGGGVKKTTRPRLLPRRKLSRRLSPRNPRLKFLVPSPRLQQRRRLLKAERRSKIGKTLVNFTLF